MKYSEVIFANKASESQLNKIKKLERRVDVESSTQLKTEKAKYVHAVTDVPEFNQAIDQLSKSTLSQGTDIDKEQMASLNNKIQTGVLDFEDLDGLNNLCGNNFKLLFSVDPESEKVHSTIWFGLIFATAAIFLRFGYEFDGSTNLLIYLTIINVIAIAYTLLFWHKATIEDVEEWLDKNHLNQAFKRKIINKVSKKLWCIVATTFALIMVGLIVAWVFNFISLGNDIASILSLAMSILSPYIIRMFAQHYELNIYHNES